MAILIIIFILIHSSKGILKVEEDNFAQICHMEEVDFWKFYYWSFKSSDHLFINLFQTSESSNILNKFLNELLLQLSSHRLYKRSFTISKYDLITETKEVSFIANCKENLLEINATLFEVLHMVANEGKEDESELQERIRSFSADLNYRYIILVHDEKDLLDYLEDDWRKVFPNPRGIFVIIFVSTEQLKKETVEELFKTIWYMYGVLNIIFQQPCICNFTNLYSYDPFYPRENTWGIVKNFHIDEAILKPALVRRILQKLNWYPLKISMFAKTPSAVSHFPKFLHENDIYKNLTLSLGFAGQDGMVLKTLCELLKLTPINASGAQDYGYEMDGKFYGSIGELANRTIDISLNSRYIEGVGLDVIEYLTPLSNDKFCVIVPKSLEVPHYLMIFHCFSWRSWLIILMSYIIASFYWFLVRPITVTSKKLQRSCVISFMEVFCLFVSIPMQLFVTSTNHRIFFIACMIFNIIIIGAFQGTLVTSFSTTMHYPDIDTLEEFDKSGLMIMTSSRGVLTVFGNDGSEIYDRLNTKVVFVNQLSYIFKNISTYRNVATLDRRSDAILKAKMYFTSSEDVELIHIVKECPRSYHFTYILPKGSLFVHVFNIIITVLREAGLLIKWNSDIVDALVYETRKKRITPTKHFRGFTLDDMKIAFYILLAGYFISFAICVIEIVWKKNFKKHQMKTYQKKN